MILSWSDQAWDAYFNNNKVIAYNTERAIQIAQEFREAMTV